MKVLVLLFQLLVLVLAGDDSPGPALSVVSYAPSTNVECPDLSTTSLIRTIPLRNQSLHPSEQAYVAGRQATTALAAWKDWLGDGSALGYNLTAYSGPFPSIGIAIPGGGLRAAQYGAGSLLALDSRNATAKAAGTGGLLQVASYMSGLSGTSYVDQIQVPCLKVLTRWFMGNWLSTLQ